MLSKRKRNIILLSAGAIIIVALAIELFMHHFSHRESGPRISCNAFFTVEFTMKSAGVLSFNLDGSGHGHMDISANVTDASDQLKYKLLRNITFDYHNEGNGYLSLKEVHVIKLASDTMPNKLFNESLFDFSLSNRRLRITEVNNGYLLWNTFSPVMMCVQDV